jgi:hypothetical protein
MSETVKDQLGEQIGIPTAQTMLIRLHEIDLDQLNLKKVEEQIRGNRVWINILTVPITMLLLVLFTFLGAWISGHFILSFLVSAGVLFFIGKMFESYDQQVKWDARREVERRIAELEGDFGLLIHFKPFLPPRYRHLVQSLKRRRYLYIDQYIQAVNLLQQKLDHDRFTQAWHMVYPELLEQPLNSEEQGTQEYLEAPQT